MKKLMKNISYISCMLFSTLLITDSFAQTKTPAKTQQPTQMEPRKLNDQKMSSQLQRDLSTRNPKVGDQPVGWVDTGYGFYGNYVMDNQDYIARYNKKGEYVETLGRKEWDSNVSSSLQSSFKSSPYANQQVQSYWEVVEPQRKGYYFELKDDKGTTSRVWADESGKFSPMPAVPGSAGQKIPQKMDSVPNN